MSGKKPHSEYCHPEMVREAARMAKYDKHAAFSRYIQLRYRATGHLAPGCDARDFFAAYDLYVDQKQEPK